MHEKIEAFVLHYSDLHDKEISKMIKTEKVSSEEDAKKLLSFIDVLFKSSSFDIEGGRFFYGEREDNYAAEKGALAIFAFLRLIISLLLLITGVRSGFPISLAVFSG